MTAITNKTDEIIELGGVKIAPASQQTTRAALITEDEKQAILENGGVIHFGMDVITVSKAEAKAKDVKKDVQDVKDVKDVKTGKGDGDVTGDGEAGDKDIDADKDEDSDDVKHLAYPKSLITSKGKVSGQRKHKGIVESLQDAYDNLLDDNAFIKTYPDADIEAFRVVEPEEA